MDTILKSARLEKAEVSDSELALINRQTLRAMTAEELFTFRLAACDNQVDRDYERFTDNALEEFAKLFEGKPVLRDHKWSADTQTARVYAGTVEQDGAAKRLILRCYMPRTAQTADTITAIESGILRECSVGVAVKRSICSVCGTDQAERICKHWPGREYDGVTCHFDLDGAADAYEVSLVAVPAQKEAGVTKTKRYGGAEEPPAEPGQTADAQRELALLDLEALG